MIKAPQPLQTGQTTLDSTRSLPQRPHGSAKSPNGVIQDIAMAEGPTEVLNPQIQRPGSSKANSNGLVFEHYEPNGTSRRDDLGDVEMA